jgi:hypothetical protein
MMDRHPHWINKSSGSGPPGGAGPPAGHPAGPIEAEAPPVQPPADSAAEQYRAITEVTADWAYALHIEPDGRTITDWMTQHVQEVTGFNTVDLGPVDAWLRMIHKDDRNLMRSHLAALQAGRSDTIEYRVVTASG